MNDQQATTFLRRIESGELYKTGRPSPWRVAVDRELVTTMHARGCTYGDAVVDVARAMGRTKDEREFLAACIRGELPYLDTGWVR